VTHHTYCPVPVKNILRFSGYILDCTDIFDEISPATPAGFFLSDGKLNTGGVRDPGSSSQAVVLGESGTQLNQEDIAFRLTLRSRHGLFPNAVEERCLDSS
jgi:hypothetical protein